MAFSLRLSCCRYIIPYNSELSGFPENTIEVRRKFEARLREQARATLPPMPPQKKFSPKMGLPTLKDYRARPKASFWKAWPKRTFEQVLPPKSWVSDTRLRRLAKEYKYPKWEKLEQVCKRLKEGADIGCVGPARRPKVGENGQSAFMYGDRVCDALAEMIKDGIMAGPLDEEEIPWEDITVSPIMVRLKPNGKARIIINLSHPKNG